MEPINFKQVNVVYGKNQPEYRELPAFKNKDGLVVSCWQLSFKERLKILFGGKIWLSLSTFNRPLTPSFLTTNKADVIRGCD